IVKRNHLLSPSSNPLLTKGVRVTERGPPGERASSCRLAQSRRVHRRHEGPTGTSAPTSDRYRPQTYTGRTACRTSPASKTAHHLPHESFRGAESAIDCPERTGMATIGQQETRQGKMLGQPASRV